MEAHATGARPPREGPRPPQQGAEEAPMLVNAKQYNRILKRRLARAKLETLRRVVGDRKNYLHESRHKHACRRKRGPGGRFLTKPELDAIAREEAEAAAKAPAAGDAPAATDAEAMETDADAPAPPEPPESADEGPPAAATQQEALQAQPPVQLLQPPLQPPPTPLQPPSLQPRAAPWALLAAPAKELPRYHDGDHAHKSQPKAVQRTGDDSKASCAAAFKAGPTAAAKPEAATKPAAPS
ncbi:CCAAT-binding transcription factor (CBF-B/NF-YA) subunit B-domain-containing protein [Pelagophyceae sp. CCMP2097]|nr:CCAAT-binding transcription factor (CBF-B/NF-YA) subunit B-domain-containing protein [Pelagophyceae sp. CCMP2097]